MILLTMILTKYALIHSISDLITSSSLQFIFAVFAVICITAAGYIINDIFDIEADRINKEGLNLIGLAISRKKAWYLYLFFNFLGLFLGIYTSLKNNARPLIWVFTTSILVLFLYSYLLKKIAVLGNVVVAVLCSMPILITYALQNAYASSGVENHIYLYNVVLCYSIFSILTTFVREIIKDIADVDGDLKINAKTIPIIFGRKRAANFAFIFSAVLFILLLVILQNLKEEPYYLMYGVIFLIVPLLYFMFLLWTAKTKKEFTKLSGIMKTIMLFGILSMLLFSL